MIILKLLLFVICAVGIPTLLGAIVTSHMDDRFHNHLLSKWVMGIALMFCELQLMAVPMIIKDMKFHTLFNIYVAFIIAQAIFAVFRYGMQIVSEVKQIPKRTMRNGFLGALLIISILLQGFMLMFFEHRDDDDARFVPSAVAAVEKDMMFEENPVTGEMMYSRISEVFKDMVSPWIMFWAVLSKITMIHPAILMHSVVPFFFIPLAYAVYWMLAGTFFGDDNEKKVIFVGIISLIHYFSGYSTYNGGAFLLFRIWQGKALFAAIFVPLLLLMAVRLFEKQTVDKWDYIAMTIINCGACLTSGFGIILTAMFMGIISVIYGIVKKTPKKMLFVWLTIIPCVVYGYLYAFGANLFR